MRRRALPVLVPLALFLAAAIPLRVASDRVLPQLRGEPFGFRYLPSGKNLRALSPAVRLSVADYYWLLAVQYIGDQHLRRGRFEQLYPVMDLVTDLDPGHGYAFQTAGIALSSAGQLDASDAILQKGITHGPNWWSYPFYIAFNHFFYRGDYVAGAAWAERAARTPGASSRIAQLALALRVRSGSPDDAVRFIEELLPTARDPQMAAQLQEHHRVALLMRDFAHLDAAVGRFGAERGRPPHRLEELVTAGLLPALPVEPYGGSYVLRGGQVHTTTADHDRRYAPPEGPHPPRWPGAGGMKP